MRRLVPSEVPPLVMQAVARANVRFQVPVRVLLGVAWVESHFDALAGSAQRGVMLRGPAEPAELARLGLMGLTAARARGLGVDPFNAEAAAMGAARYIGKAQQQLGSWERALAAYRWTPERVAALPEPQQWPWPVLQYVRHVGLAGPAARVPYPLEVVYTQLQPGQRPGVLRDAF